jgi:hypothetical protein
MKRSVRIKKTSSFYAPAKPPGLAARLNKDGTGVFYDIQHARFIIQELP